MKINTEIILTNIPLILEQKSAGFTYNEIAKFFNKQFQIDINEKQIRNYLQYIKNDKLHKKYKTFVLIPLTVDVGKLIDYSLIEHDLIITTPIVANFFELSHEILTPKNFRNKLKTEEGLLYAKRLLQQYLIDDNDMLDYARKTNPAITKVDYQTFIENLHTTLAIEVQDWIIQLKAKLNDFFIMKRTI